jgi:CHAD domain-containing protein
MAYKFRADEPVRSAIARCATEQLDGAVSELTEAADTDPAEAIHDARKAIKKARSLLRLARGAMPRDRRQHENAALREVARSLSSARDADVMIASIDELSERFAGQLPSIAFGRIRAHLEARRSAARGQEDSQTTGRRAAHELGAVRARVADWQLGTGGWQALESGLARSYTRGRNAFIGARLSGDTEALHAWRKRVKDLWYHERLLAPTCGPTVRGHAKDLDRLADLLGDDHDLALLGHELAEDEVPAAVDIDAVRGLIGRRRAELQTEAARLGERVYAEKPKAFVRRMRRSWEAGRAMARKSQEQRPSQLAAATR